MAVTSGKIACHIGTAPAFRRAPRSLVLALLLDRQVPVNTGRAVLALLLNRQVPQSMATIRDWHWQRQRARPGRLARVRANVCEKAIAAGSLTATRGDERAVCALGPVLCVLPVQK